MRLTNISEVNSFISTVNACEGDVWLESGSRSVINLKSKLSQYIAISALLSIEGHNLELYCSMPKDEARFFKFFHDHPNVM